jgi:hypothetical protein
MTLRIPLYAALCAGFVHAIFVPVISAQTTCNDLQASDYFKPLTSGEGMRYPLTIGPISWRILGPSIQPVMGSDGLTHLAYSLLLTNSWGQPAVLKSIEVVDPAHDYAATGKNEVLTINNDDVTGELRLLSLPGTLDKANYRTEVPSGQSAVAFFDVTYSDSAQVPRAIAHRVTVGVIGREGKPQDLTVLSPPLRLSCIEPIVLAPPLKGEGWINGNGCCKEIGPHRFVMNSINGSLAPTEEFAIDWIRVNPQGRLFTGDPKDPKHWYGYGAELLAVAPGTVIEVVSDLPDQPAGKSPEGLTIEQIAGNRVILDLGFGRYAYYAHIAPHTTTVRVGEYVRQGQKIGLLGNTGNTDAPHLHFQLIDRPSTLDGSALPFVFDRMQLQGRVTVNLNELDGWLHKTTPVPVNTKGAKLLTRSMPLSLDVITFK